MGGGDEGRAGNGEEMRTKIHHVKVRDPNGEYHHIIYLKCTDKLNE